MEAHGAKRKVETRKDAAQSATSGTARSVPAEPAKKDIDAILASGNFRQLHQPDAKGKLAVSRVQGVKTQVMAHYYREEPQLFALTNMASKPFFALKNAVASQQQGTADVNAVMAWLNLRGFNTADFFLSITEQKMMWGPKQEYHYPDFGKTWRCVLKDPIPKLGGTRDRKEYREDGSIFVSDGYYAGPATPCVHSSSFYSAAKILKKGLATGESSKREKVGVYCFNMKNAVPEDTAVKSHGYAVYTNLFNDKVWWGIKYEMQAMEWYAGYANHAISAGGRQWCFPEDLQDGLGPWFHVTAVWFHAATLEELQDSYAMTEAQFFKEYELEP